MRAPEKLVISQYTKVKLDVSYYLFFIFPLVTGQCIPNEEKKRYINIKHLI